MSVTLSDARVVTPDGVHDGWLTIEDGRITHIGRGQAPRDGLGLGGRTVVPGFVDIHTHGGAGGSFPDGDPETAATAAALHLSRGSTTLMASLVTAAPDTLTRAASALADLCEQGLLAGIHFEGPYIARSRCGAHEPTLLREPDVAEFRALVKAGRGHVRMLTIAPELPNALDVIRDAAAEGVAAALGHSDATYEQTIEGIDAGATVATHLYNAMPPLGHRAPGPIAALLQDERVTVELINDGVHVHPAMLRLAMHAAGAGRTALVTDAMAATGMGDGRYPLGPMTVDVVDGVARLASDAPGGGPIAGSTLTMDVAFRRTVREAGRSPVDAALMASLTPARVLGLDGEIGSITVGKYADLVVLDDDLRVGGVMKRGAWVRHP
ncbi:N-acetylglucosamine-6-phosphate deacetylase [Microbispora bryophytorum]|uniref:N-acetylglucosamine-6-phosphate deacetylase n=1 Tax=Microbispora bryophytorum TaxID=1460882 RepID=A0A8H9GW99_9ACTN|nr:N-acetylglucosamine-6-phosphate deacetylase [Microbispora bryophytorum]MBD3135978.1 N-acetylglucosamine-6-phosphate deacetylase [Microbispora bryophytorum]TQS07744.1 N-acetylglucosamine-6-phosphate deacetylase [Microbispora bryophytorum]GGO03804.1 N-acetylglucosamine-6-phosphate deacetylase [Microbispora bryophytorum]